MSKSFSDIVSIFGPELQRMAIDLHAQLTKDSRNMSTENMLFSLCTYTYTLAALPPDKRREIFFSMFIYAFVCCELMGATHKVESIGNTVVDNIDKMIEESKDALSIYEITSETIDTNSKEMH